MRYEFDPEHSLVWIHARSSLHPINSESSGIEGYFEAEVGPGGVLDVRVPPKGRLELPVVRLTSSNPLYDSEMRRRIDARRFPVITGELGEMRPAGEPGRYRVGGDVSFRGVTRRVEDELALSVPDEGTVVIEGSHAFDVRDFGMAAPRIMMFKVYPDVTVRVRIVAEAR